jgi:hypothetical protein
MNQDLQLKEYNKRLIRGTLFSFIGSLFALLYLYTLLSGVIFYNNPDKELMRWHFITPSILSFVLSLIFISKSSFDVSANRFTKPIKFYLQITPWYLFYGISVGIVLFFPGFFLLVIIFTGFTDHYKSLVDFISNNGDFTLIQTSTTWLLVFIIKVLLLLFFSYKNRFFRIP